jgi:hypothetical protein
MRVEDEQLLDASSTPVVILPPQARPETWDRDAPVRRLMLAILTDAIRCYERPAFRKRPEQL